MARICTSIVAAALCLTTSIGCKSRLLGARTNTSRSAEAVAEAAEPPSNSDLDIGRASYEQLAENPTSTAWGRLPYHFGGSSSGSAPFRNAATSRRC